MGKQKMCTKLEIAQSAGLELLEACREVFHMHKVDRGLLKIWEEIIYLNDLSLDKWCSVVNS